MIRFKTSKSRENSVTGKKKQKKKKKRKKEKKEKKRKARERQETGKVHSFP